MTNAIQPAETAAALTIQPADQGQIALAVGGYLATMRTDDSRRTMRAALRVLAGIASEGGTDDPTAIPWHRMAPAHVGAICSTLASRYAPSTANHRTNALRGLVRSLWREGLLTADQRDRLQDAATPTKGRREPKGQHISLDQRAKLMEACAADPSDGAARDAAIIALLYGARRSEVAAVQLADLDLDGGSVLLRGKGRKERRFALDAGAVAALRAWVEVRGTEPGPLFLRTRKGGQLAPGGLTARSIENALIRRATAAGLPSVRCHDLRRTYIGDAMDGGADLRGLADQVGHASIQTTMGYDRRGERVQRSVAQRVSTPFVARVAV